MLKKTDLWDPDARQRLQKGNHKSLKSNEKEQDMSTTGYETGEKI